MPRKVTPVPKGAGRCTVSIRNMRVDLHARIRVAAVKLTQGTNEVWTMERVYNLILERGLPVVEKEARKILTGEMTGSPSVPQ